ncbi:uncharacterized protein MYCGRDRAFT_95359 [Zymoseptoria tritici IPO323]|uniref:Uncharacterized protein n=1 Tax=Zymoseptoria tritici (strain CBS 115943 / IPO323) TaxID=336722 RepID=F9XIR2_ZYMTI|nr:uncharacterized protein MYCGRDRAFT_95359 [Zymoseptoria tritici IPO323]EGP85246.1 hypothetical protein MYCGRDRAFT_95359 [Zymoseptoria tritici IPO323]
MDCPPDHYSEDSDDPPIKARMKALRESTAELLQREAARYSSDELDKAYSSYLNEAGFQVALLQQGAMHGFMYRLFKAWPDTRIRYSQPPLERSSLDPNAARGRKYTNAHRPAARGPVVQSLLSPRIPHDDEETVAATLFPAAVADEYDEAQIIEGLNRGGVADFLAHATDPRVLQVRCPNTYYNGPWVSLNAIIPDRLWPNLQSIDLFGFECTEDKLVRFVTKCCATVSEFCVKCPLLTHGRWTSVFRRVAGMFRSFKSFGFEASLLTRDADDGRLKHVGMGNIYQPDLLVHRDLLYDFLRNGGPEPHVITSGYFGP